MRVVVFGAAGWLGRAVLQNFKGKYEIRAFDHGPEAWDSWNDLEGEWQGGEKVDGDIASFKDVQNALKGVDCVVHTAVYFPGSDAESDNNPFLVNLKGLWNVLEGARRQRCKKSSAYRFMPDCSSRRDLFFRRCEKTGRKFVCSHKTAAGGDVQAVL